ncbi:ATP-binding protein [Streptomyces sp. CWNU-52B]|uniref:ATP-binding protein n=1 Tax=unclassified Streptomyces TaxID=2593676 RepID=UPI0039C2DF44
MLRRNSFRLPRHPASVGLARRRVRDHLSNWGHSAGEPAYEDAVLLVSELATNAVRHAPLLEREFEVAVTTLADGSCLIEVSDESPVQPRLRPAGEGEDRDEESEYGRGLRLVDGLTATWGVWSRGRHGKTVWALLPAAR